MDSGEYSRSRRTVSSMNDPNPMALRSRNPAIFGVGRATPLASAVISGSTNAWA